MPAGYSIDIEIDERFLAVRVDREVPYSFDAVMQVVAQVALEARRCGKTRVLYETVHSTDEIPDADHYQLLRRIDEAAGSLERLAIVSRGSRARDLIEDMAVNRGFTARVFAARAEAAAWLNGR